MKKNGPAARAVGTSDNADDRRAAGGARLVALLVFAMAVSGLQVLGNGVHIHTALFEYRYPPGIRLDQWLNFSAGVCSFAMVVAGLLLRLSRPVLWRVLVVVTGANLALMAASLCWFLMSFRMPWIR